VKGSSLPQDREPLSEYRLKDSKEKLKAAEVLLKQRLYKDSISRSYYAMFSAARALLATKKLDSRKHSGVISLFNQHFVKTGLIARDCGRMLLAAREARERGDYEDFLEVNEVEATSQFAEATRFIAEVESALTMSSRGPAAED
jgi:uncharacterized protein (UPF0332 family)